MWLGDRVVERITTSGGYGYWLDRSLAVPTGRELSLPGTRLAVDVLGDRRPAVVLAEPPFDPEMPGPELTPCAAAPAGRRRTSGATAIPRAEAPGDLRSTELTRMRK